MLTKIFLPSIYGYANAKAHAIKSQLLPKSFMLDALSVNTLQGLYELLKGTHYKEYLNENIIKEHGISTGIEICLWNRFNAIKERIKKAIPKKDIEIFNIFLLRYEIRNAKIVFSKIILGKDQRIFITENEKLWEKIEKSDKPFETFFTSHLWKTVEKYLSKNYMQRIKNKQLDINEFFSLLDESYIEALKALKDTRTYKYEMINADIPNLIKIIKAIKENKEIKESDLINGSINKRVLLSCIKDEKTLTSILKIYGLKKEDDINAIVRKSRMYLIRKLRANFINAGFSIDKAMLLMLMLENEILLLRKIILQKTMHIEKKLILEEINNFYGG
jgi:vacuolar-type H+-ATPase subunit C/Vma6